MCSTRSNVVNDALSMEGTGDNSNSNSTSTSNSNSTSTATIRSIAAHQVRQKREKFFLVDIREDSEIQEQPMSDMKADARIPMGVLCLDASILVSRTDAQDKAKGDFDNENVSKPLVPEGKTIVLVCGTGRRAKMMAHDIMGQHKIDAVQVAVLQRGILGWQSMAAVIPDFLVVLGVDQDTEKLSLSLAAAANAIEIHKTTVLVLMSKGVHWFVNPDSPKCNGYTNVETVSQGEPFKSCKVMLTKFLNRGGIILGCTTCVEHRGLSFEFDMMECVDPMQMPDLIRMLGEAKGGTLQFM